MAEKEDVDAMIEAVRWGSRCWGLGLLFFWLKLFFGRSWECEVIYFWEIRVFLWGACFFGRSVFW